MFNEERLKIMKTTMQYIIFICLLALGVTQVTAVEYKSTYHRVQTQPAFGVVQGTTTPSTTFHSTSAYSEQMNQEEAILNSDGSVNEGIYISGPRRLGGAPTPGGGGGPGTPGDPDDDDQQPLGDVLFPLMLMALAYIVIRVYRRRKA